MGWQVEEEMVWQNALLHLPMRKSKLSVSGGKNLNCVRIVWSIFREKNQYKISFRLAGIARQPHLEDI